MSRQYQHKTSESNTLQTSPAERCYLRQVKKEVFFFKVECLDWVIHFKKHETCFVFSVFFFPLEDDSFEVRYNIGNQLLPYFLSLITLGRNYTKKFC